MAVRYRKGKRVEGVANKYYEIEKDLSTGAFAVSYLAYAPDGRKVFLKQYKSPSVLVDWYKGYVAYQNELKRRVNGSPELRERTNEFIDFFERDRTFIQVFEFIEGGKDLRRHLEGGALTLRERYTFASLFLYSLKLFHEAGIVHTDLKPENVYLIPSAAKIGFTLKLIDFDFAILEDARAPWHGSMNYCGTPRYMSPEHLSGKVPERRSDVFTAALICYELLSKGGHPYPEEEDAYAEAAKAGRPPRPEFPVPESPAVKRLGDLLVKALSASPKDRPYIGDLHQAILGVRPDFLSGSPSAPPPPPKPSPEKIPPPASPPPAPPPRPSPEKLPPSAPPPPATGNRIGLSMKGSSATDWFRTTTGLGNRLPVPALADIVRYFASTQFVLRREGSAWFADPPSVPPANMTLVNGAELTAPVKLSDGDTICLGSRSDPARRNLFPMTVHIQA